MQAAFLVRGTTLHAHGAIGPTYDIRFRNTPTARPLSEWVRQAKANIKLANAPNDRPLRITHFHPGPGEVTVGQSDWPAFKELVRLVSFAPELEAAARSIISQLTTPDRGFTGVHLRVEEDFVRHQGSAKDPFYIKNCRAGTIQCLQNAYLPILREHTSSDPYYLASGIIAVPMDNTRQVLDLLESVAPVWNHSHQFLTAAQLQQLVRAGCEQVAAVDLLVLAHANVFIGMLRSTFSCFVSMYRASLGLPGRLQFVDSFWDIPVRNFLPHFHTIAGSHGRGADVWGQHYGTNQAGVKVKGKVTGKTNDKGTGRHGR
eukprot:EG_transcript_9920